MLAVKRGRLWLESRAYFQNILLASCPLLWMPLQFAINPGFSQIAQLLRTC